jgi:hypothetical protein
MERKIIDAPAVRVGSVYDFAVREFVMERFGL